MKAIFTSVLLILTMPFIKAQDSSVGTEFWLAYMENLDLLFNDAPVFAIQIASETTTSGEISIPATGLTIPFAVAGGTVEEITLPQAIYYSEDSEEIDDKGIKITANAPVRVNAMHYRAYFSESSMVLPTPVLSDTYRVIAREDDGGGAGPSSFVIVSTEDDNEIEITPTALTLGLHPENVPFTITLNEGQIYQVQAIGNLTGSSIQSLTNQKMAVFSGARQAIVEQCGGFADSHLWDQCHPFDLWDAFYYFVPFKNQGGDLVRILANEDNTTVYLDCNEAAFLQTGESFDIKLTQATVINATAPIAVSQFNSAQECNASMQGDPSMLRLLPTKFQNQAVRFRSSNASSPLGFNYFAAHFVNIVINTTDVGSVTLDGANISAEFSPFPADPNLSFAQVSISSGDHFLTADAPFNTYAYGWGDFDGYTSNLGFQSSEDQEFLCLEIEADGLFCTDSTLVFTAEANQEIATYNWMTSDGQMATTPTANFVFTTPGEYTVMLVATATNGSTYEADYTFSVIDCDADPCEDDAMIILETMGTLCNTNPVDFSYTAAIDFVAVQWEFSDGYSTNQESPSYTFGTAGIYQIFFTGTDVLNCSYGTVIEIVIADCNDPCFLQNTLEIFVDGDLCVGEELTFSSNFVEQPDDFVLLVEWIFSNGSTLDEFTTTNIFDTPGTQQIQLNILTLQCDYTVFTEIVIEDCDDPCSNLPPVSIIENNPYCVNEPLTLSLNTTADLALFSWELQNMEVSAADTVQFQFSETGIYTVSFFGEDANGCEYTTATDILVEDCTDPCADLPTVDIDFLGEFCPDSLITFSINTTADLTSFNWTLGNGEMSNLSNPTTTYEFAEVYQITLTATDANDCEYLAEAAVEIFPCLDDCLFPPPTIEVSGDTNFCIGDTIQLSGFSDAPAVEFAWTLSDGQTFTEQNIEFTSQTEGELLVELLVTDVNGCEFENSLILTGEDCVILEDCELFVPNAFTPNGDSTNDVFKAISDCEPTIYDLKIFNRWGSLVFETTNFNETWDGIFNGKNVSADVYVYLIEYAFDNGESERLAGDVAVIR